MLPGTINTAYWNRLYDLGERPGPFSCYGQINANSADKERNITNILYIRKWAHQIVKYAYH